MPRPKCPGPGCPNLRGRGRLLCKPCWLRVPDEIRLDMARAFNRNRGDHQNAAWLAAAARAINSLRQAA